MINFEKKNVLFIQLLLDDRGWGQVGIVLAAMIHSKFMTVLLHEAHTYTYKLK